ncbi:hypothetical protein F511_20455 [Dorcoceras hygrometricum]|uniref:Uncharacterized protein n=1 Tax=Dorcoceras hygrometricum TaxID=472368 RepID=A0A2Z7DFB6_9LAMI|nr:hypothetical protein F511_20455 [Dorcoceras hygrometricum]
MTSLHNTLFITLNLIAQHTPPSLSHATAAAAGKLVSGQLDVENPFVLISSGLLVQPDEGVSDLVVDRIRDNLPQSTEKSRIIVITVGARHKCQRDISTSWLVISWESSKAGASKQLEEQERTRQAQLQTKRGADTKFSPEDQLEDENKEAGEEKERALQELMKQPA